MLEEKITFFNVLLEAERAGVEVLSSLAPQIENENLKNLLLNFLGDEGMNCQILAHLIKLNHGKISNKTGNFGHKFGPQMTHREKLALLARGQEWVVKQIRKNQHLCNAGSENFFLEAIKRQHEENVDALNALI